MIALLRFVVAIVLLPFGRGPAFGAWLIEEKDWDLCQCAIDPKHKGFCRKCFGMQAVPQFSGYDVMPISELSDNEKRKVGDECIALFGYERCKCIRAYGPDRLCPKCQGTGAVKPTQ